LPFFMLSEKTFFTIHRFGVSYTYKRTPFVYTNTKGKI